MDEVGFDPHSKIVNSWVCFD